jgi:hypothetical protein
MQRLGRVAPRGAKSRLLFDNRILLRRPCESRDPIHRVLSLERESRDLRSQRRPVAMGPCFRRDDVRVSPAHSRDPLARNDGLLISIDAVSLVVSRLQFTQAAYKTSHFEIFALNSSARSKFVLDRVALSGELSIHALGKAARNGVPKSQMFVTAQFAGA